MEKLIFGTQIALIGMGIVATSLILLTIVTKGMSRAANGIFTKQKKEVPAKQQKEKQLQDDGNISPELIAVITVAAIAQFRGVFEVKTIRRIENNINGGWKQMAAQEQVQAFSQR